TSSAASGPPTSLRLSNQNLAPRWGSDERLSQVIEPRGRQAIARKRPLRTSALTPLDDRCASAHVPAHLRKAIVSRAVYRGLARLIASPSRGQPSAQIAIHLLIRAKSGMMIDLMPASRIERARSV